MIISSMRTKTGLNPTAKTHSPWVERFLPFGNLDMLADVKKFRL